MLRRFSFHFLSVFLILLVFSLSYWQFERGKFKSDLIESIKEAGLRPAIDLSKETILPDFELYRKYIFSGDLLFSESMFVFTAGYNVSPLRSSGVGYWLIVPLMIEQSSSNILVNLGFIDDDKLEFFRPMIFNRPMMHVSVEAEARSYNRVGFFVAEASIDKRVVYDFIASDFARILPNNFVEYCYFQLSSAIMSLGDLRFPLAPEKVRLPDNHLQYALTWLFLGICVSGMYLLMILRRF